MNCYQHLYCRPHWLSAPLLQYCSCTSSHHFENGRPIYKVESVQRNFTKRLRGMSDLSHSDKETPAFSLPLPNMSTPSKQGSYSILWSHPRELAGERDNARKNARSKITAHCSCPDNAIGLVARCERCMLNWASFWRQLGGNSHTYLVSACV